MDAITTTEVRGSLTMSDRARAGREAVRVFPNLAQRRRARMWKVVLGALVVGVLLGVVAAQSGGGLLVVPAVVASFVAGWWIATVSLVRSMPHTVVQQFDGQRAVCWCGPGMYSAIEWAHVEVAVTRSAVLAALDRHVVMNVPIRLCAPGQVDAIVQLATAGGAIVREA